MTSGLIPRHLFVGVLFLCVGAFLLSHDIEREPTRTIGLLAGGMSLFAGFSSIITFIAYRRGDYDPAAWENVFKSPFWQRFPTYWWENLFVSVYLGMVTLIAAWDLSGIPAVAQFLGAIAVFFTFQHVSVANRLEEAQDRSDVKTVECYRKLTRFLIIKEILWVAVFALTGAWTALAGIPIFLLYPAWRRFYASRR